MPQQLPCGATIAAPGDLPGALITAPRQIEFRGLLLGSGTPYRWKSLTGWDDEPGIDLSDAPRDTGDGDYAGPGWRQSRMVSMELQVQGYTRALMEEALQLLRARMAYRNTEDELHIADSGRHDLTHARVVARAIPHTPGRSVGVLDGVAVQWKATDPHRYSPTRRTVTLAPTAGEGGVTYPVEYPVGYGTSAGAGSAMAVNDGTEPAPAVVTFRGPTTAVPYGVAADGRWLRMDLPLASQDRLTVDTRTGSITLNGGADRSNWLNPTSVSPESWVLPPGESAVEALGVTADVEWSDTSM